MDHSEKNLNRRSFFRWGFLTLAALPFLGQKVLAGACPAQAPAGKNAVDPAGAIPKNLNYVSDASAASTHKLFKAGSNCGNCSFYKKDKEDHQWAPCTMLGLKYVPACGWCKSYKKKA